MTTPPAGAGAPSESQIGTAEYARAVLNIMEDSAVERARLVDTQKAVLNLLEDFDTENERLIQTQKAVLNILDDLGSEKERLERASVELLRSEEAIKKSLHEKEILLKEIHHRVKNNLQIISSLLLLQSRHLADRGARDILKESQNRVRSIALVHEKLHQSSDLTHVDLGEYIETLAEVLFRAYNAAERGIVKVVNVRGRMTVDAAVPCGLIINELITNALKHGFPPGRGGTVRVRAEDVDGRLVMIVEDDGVGLPEGVDPRSGRSLGLDLVLTLARQLKAEVDIVRSGGTRFRFLFAGAGQGGGRGDDDHQPGEWQDNPRGRG